MRYTLFDDTETRSDTDYRADSRQLDAFRRCDFGTAMDGEVGRVFKRGSLANLTASTRYFPLVERVCRDKGRQYVKAPTRRFERVRAVEAAKLEDIYTSSRFDTELMRAQQKAVAQNSVLLAPEPAAGASRRMRLLSFIPGDFYVEQADLLNDDLRYADKVTIKVPIRRDGDTVWYGRRVYTQSEAWIEAPGGKRVGIYEQSGRNPYGYIPLVGVRLTDPMPGYWRPPLRLDLSSVQIGLILALTDIENICRMKCAGREVIAGPGANSMPNLMEFGPEGVMLVGGSSDLEYQYVSIDPRIDRYLVAVETSLKVLGNLMYVSTDGLWASTGITGDAKEVEREEILEDNHRSEQIWADAEQQLAEVVAGMIRTGPRSVVATPDPLVRIDYHYVRARRNDLQTMQAFILECATGLNSAASKVSIEEGVTEDYAKGLVAERLVAWRELLESWRAQPEVQIPPGLESIGGQLFGGSDPEPRLTIADDAAAG